MTDEEKYLAVIDRMIDLEQVLRWLLRQNDAIGPCVLDDDQRYCTAHGFGAPCAVARARALLAGEPT